MELEKDLIVTTDSLRRYRFIPRVVFQRVLVLMDLYTRYAVGVPTKNLSAKTTALEFYNNLVVHYRFQGGSTLIREEVSRIS